eukprot:gnl/Chilomastix_cuspidata/841.p2 GENE.gnl/Chilomastix_cuspidata/841~~gnl/Chilomastix_cuspidata/841.p2  ORF type:complete len:361 (-),score=136.11 gnl/Chilomastix_cuspidata/841:2142-3224(-)
MAPQSMAPTRNITTFNGHFGYLEAFVRAQRDNMLSAADYISLTQCASSSDVLMSLNTSYLSEVFKDVRVLDTSSMKKLLTNQLAEEFRVIRSHAEEPLSVFLDYITYSYMIDNVVLILNGTLNGRDTSHILEDCHPLGMFPTIGALAACDTVAEFYVSIMEAPIGRYLAQSFADDPTAATTKLGEEDIEVIRASMYREYLHDFYDFCKRLGGHTGAAMRDLLRFEADRQTITLALNAIERDIDQATKLSMFPNIGLLYPNRQLALVGETSYGGVTTVASEEREYRHIFDMIEQDPSVTFTDAFFMAEVELLRKCWYEQFNFGVFFAFVKLREQEIRNITWITDCIIQDNRQHINRFVGVW